MNSIIMPSYQSDDFNSFEIRLAISPRCLDLRNPFINLISQQKAYVFPEEIFFVVTSRSERSSYRVAVYQHKNKLSSFHLVSSLMNISIACSKLNLASALNCTITASLVGYNELLFTVIPPNESVGASLFRNYRVFENI